MPSAPLMFALQVFWGALHWAGSEWVGVISESILSRVNVEGLAPILTDEISILLVDTKARRAESLRLKKIALHLSGDQYVAQKALDDSRAENVKSWQVE